MIQTSLANLIVAYLLVAVGALGVLWMATDWLRRRRERRSLRAYTVCRICGETFESREEEELPRCPACGSLNEREPIREI